ncbi:MAG: hypothetical protein EU539_08375 [Promethearchaeota archaeon]|nr:MAG: hypothetical protein EU539_08375 [Candidatus Lokiarchaeota archaeon]
MKELTKKMAEMVRLQMLYNISNGWSWYAYQKLGADGIIKVELKMWDDLMPPAIDLLYQLIEPEGSNIEQAKHVLTQVSKINGYKIKNILESATSLKWEYKVCPNWNSMIQMGLDDYICKNGNPAKVSCVHGCTKIHEHYFKKINSNLKVRSIKNRPKAANTCIFELSFN